MIWGGFVFCRLGASITSRILSHSPVVYLYFEFEHLVWVFHFHRFIVGRHLSFSSMIPQIHSFGWRTQIIITHLIIRSRFFSPKNIYWVYFPTFCDMEKMPSCYSLDLRIRRSSSPCFTNVINFQENQAGFSHESSWICGQCYYLLYFVSSPHSMAIVLLMYMCSSWHPGHVGPLCLS